jgi:hypothetical protein
MVPLSYIIDYNEMDWLLDPNGVLTWVERGSESIQAKINGNEKDCLAVLASVTAVGAKITFVFIPAGRAGCIEQSQIGNVENHWRTHSISS